MTRRVASARLIGRLAELAAVDEALARVAAGSPTTLVVAGDAGVGKTRLAGEVMARSRAQGFLTLSGGCLELGEGGLPMAPLAEALRRLRAERDAGVWGDRLADVGGDLDAQLPGLLGASEPGMGVVSPGRLLELLLGLTERLAERAPLLVTIEDLHWADRSTLDLLLFLHRNLTGRVLLLGTLRSDELHRRHPLRPVLAELERSDRTLRIDLQPFDRVELAEQVEAITGDQPPRRLVDELLARTEGNPYLAEELLAAGADRADRLPDSLRDILMARLADRSDDELALLRIAAAIGVRVDDHVLRDIAELDDDGLDTSLRALVDAQLLVPEPSEDGYRFRHALMQEALYEELLPGERRRLHARIAEAMSAAGATNALVAAELAHHWYRARMLPEALAASVQAGVRAECLPAPAEALQHFDRAIELWDTVPDAEELVGFCHADLLVRAAEQADRAGAFGRAIAHMRMALAEVDPVADPMRAGVLHERLGRFRWAAEEDGLPDFEEAVRLVPADPPSPERAQVLAGYAQILMLSFANAAAVDVARDAVAMAVRVGNRSAECHARNTLGTCLATRGSVDEGLNELRRSMQLAEELDDVEHLGRAYVNLSHALGAQGCWAELLEVGEVGLPLLRELGVERTFGVFLENNMLDALIATGRWDEAAEGERSLVTRLPDGFWDYFSCGPLAADRGDVDDAHRRADLFLRLPDNTSLLQGLADSTTGWISLAIWEHRPEETRPVLERSLPRLSHENLRWRGGELLWRAVWAEADAAATARARGGVDAAERVERASGLADRLLELREPSVDGELATPPVLAMMPMVEAELARVSDADTPEQWADSAAAADEVEIVFAGAYARLRRAEAIVRTGGSRSEASALVDQARTTAIALGAKPLRDLIDEFAHRARLSIVEESEGEGEGSGELDPVDALGLSRREREVLALVASGRTNRQIAERLYISPKTASVHVSNILAKLDVASRGEAAAVAHRLGIEPADA